MRISIERRFWLSTQIVKFRPMRMQYSPIESSSNWRNWRKVISLRREIIPRGGKPTPQEHTTRTYRGTRAVTASRWENLSTSHTVNQTCTAAATRRRRTWMDMKVRLIRRLAALISNWRRKMIRARRHWAKDQRAALRKSWMPCTAWQAYRHTCRSNRSLSSTRSQAARV